MTAASISHDAGEYDWAVPADLGDANVYGLVIKLSDDASIFQYSNPFKVDGPAADTASQVVVDATATALCDIKTARAVN